MALSPAVVAMTEHPQQNMDDYRPAGVFISYASEDSDIAQAMYQTLQSLGVNDL